MKVFSRQQSGADLDDQIGHKKGLFHPNKGARREKKSRKKKASQTKTKDEYTTEAKKKKRQENPRPFLQLFKKRQISSTLPPQPSANPDYVQVLVGDDQCHLRYNVTNSDSATFDSLFTDVSIRPEGIEFADSLIRRESTRKIAEDFGDVPITNMGDYLDTPDLLEWVDFLSSIDEDLILTQYLSENQISWETLTPNELASIYLEELQKNGTPINRGVKGNHDGSFLGNGINHLIDPVIIRILILPKLEKDLHKINSSIAILEELLLLSDPGELLEIPELDQQLFSKKKINRLFGSHFSEFNTREEVEAFLHKLKETRKKKIKEIEYYKNLTKENKAVKEKLFDENKPIIPLWLTNLVANKIFGVPVGKKLDNPHTVWAEASGGEQGIVDAKDFQLLYLQSRYPEKNITRDSLDIYKSKLLAFNPETNRYKVEGLPSSNIESDRPSHIVKNFKNFWKEIRPGEYICIFEIPGRKNVGPTQQTFMLQAFDKGMQFGKRVFDIFLDGMDHTESHAQIAFFGIMSEWQRRICQSFINYMNLKYANKGGAIYFHYSHFALKDTSSKNWKKSGWKSYFGQDEVMPILFSGHRHKREIIDESKRYLLGKEFFIGKQAVNRESGFHSVIVPSRKDYMEYSAVKYYYNEEQNSLKLEVSFQDVLADHEVHPEVIQAVEELNEYTRSHWYHEASELKTDFLSASLNVFFIDQNKMLAKDAIKISIKRFEAYLEYYKTYLKFLESDLGHNNSFFQFNLELFKSLQSHYQSWIEKYQEAIEISENLSRKMAYQILSEFNTIFVHPAMEIAELIRTETPYNESPEKRKAYDFVLLLGKKSIDEEHKSVLPKWKQDIKRIFKPNLSPEELRINQRKLKKNQKDTIADTVYFEFSLPQ